MKIIRLIIISTSLLLVLSFRNGNTYSGEYSDIHIAIDSNKNISGVYEYYDAWDNKIKEFRDINLFYFVGRLEGNQADIITSWPKSDQIIKGKIIFIDSIGCNFVKVILANEPEGYAAVDFTDGSYCVKQSLQAPWKEIKLIKSNKAVFYSEPDINKVTKIYVVKNDIVKIIERKNGWLKVEYKSPVNSKKFIGWINVNNV